MVAVDAKIFGSTFFKLSRKAVQGLRPTPIETHLHCRVKAHLRFEARLYRELRLAAVLGKGNRNKRAWRQPAAARVATVGVAA